jgi:hypothetical protein
LVSSTIVVSSVSFPNLLRCRPHDFCAMVGSDSRIGVF